MAKEQNPDPSKTPKVPAMPEVAFRRISPLQLFLRVFTFVVLVLIAYWLIVIAPNLLAAYGIQFTAGGIDIFAVLMLGVLVGFIELISRYRDAPFRTALTYPGLFYMLINGVVAVMALLLIRLFGWNFMPSGANATPEVDRWTQVLVAGLGAMSVFRSSLLVIGKGDEEVSIGPSAVLEILLDTIDKEVDRFRAQSRARFVKALMKDTTYDDAKRGLPYICMAMMQNLGEKEGKEIVNAPGKAELYPTTTPEVRKLRLGLILMDVVGEDVLRQAVEIMKKDKDADPVELTVEKNVVPTDWRKHADKVVQETKKEDQ